MALDFGGSGGVGGPISIFPTPAQQLDNEIQAGVPINRANFYFVGADITEGTMGDTASEVTVLEYTIPKYTIENGIIIETRARTHLESTSDANYAIWRIKAGTSGSEVTKFTTEFQTRNYWGVNSGDWQINQSESFKTVVPDLDWTQEQKVIVTAQWSEDPNSNVLLNENYGEALIISGY